ncbi:MAG: nitroreductase family protein [Candidatus Aminicenantes bacterium]|nr:nitroreductase family protein [Candidatus Aminicenantes bacterium]
MIVYDLIRSRRTIRQFKPGPVPPGLLTRLVDAARLAPSAANLQPLVFVAVDDPALCARILPCLKWAAYIAPQGDPRPGFEPSAYVLVLVNTTVRDKMYEYDVGAAVENMILSALAEGVGSCWMISIDRPKLAEILGVPEGYRLDSVLALGAPAEQPLAEDLKDSVKYWKDDVGRLHVPKRPLAEVLHLNGFKP